MRLSTMQFELFCVSEGDEFLGQAILIVADVMWHFEMDL